MPLETLKNGSFGLSHILFAGYAENGVNQVGTFACEVLLQLYVVPVIMQVIFPLWSRLGQYLHLFNEIGNVSDLSK